MSVKSLKRLVDNARNRVNGRKAMFIPAISVLSFLVVGYTALDKEKPVIATDEIKLEYGEEFDVSRLIISDNHDEVSELEIVADISNLDVHRLGEYRINVSAMDRCKNEAVKEIVVNVVDTTRPELIVNQDNSSLIYTDGKIKINVNASSDITQYVQAIDNADGDISSFIDVITPLDTSVLGEQEVKLAIKDSSGNKNEASFGFVITDIAAPTIVWKPSSEVVVDYGKTFDLRDYADVIDNATPYEELVINFENTIDTGVIGVVESKIEIIDSSGNKTEDHIKVEVKDISEPVIMVSQDAFSITEGDHFDIDQHVTAIDNKDGDISHKVVVEGSVNTNAAGTYSLVIRVVDEAGNEATRLVNVTVEAPYIAPTFSNGGGNGSVTSIGLGLVGRPYVYGSTGPSAFDCSGFTSYVYSQSGQSIGRTTYAQYAGGTKVSDIQPGDLLFYNTVGNLGHVAIYLGNGQMVHCGSEDTGVEVTSIYGAYWQSRYQGAVRY